MSARSKQQAAAAVGGSIVSIASRVFFAARLPLLLVDYVLREAHDDLRLLRRARQSAGFVSICSVRAAGACGARSPSPLAAPCHWNCCRQNPARCAASLQTVALQSCVESIYVCRCKKICALSAHTHTWRPQPSLRPGPFSYAYVGQVSCQFQAVRRGVRSSDSECSLTQTNVRDHA